MTRETILRNPGYWIAKIQTHLYNCAENFMKENGMNRVQLAKHLGVSKSYVSQLLNGDYDHKLSKMVELALAFNTVPSLELQPIDEFINQDSCNFEWPSSRPATYLTMQEQKCISFMKDNAHYDRATTNSFDYIRDCA